MARDLRYQLIAGVGKEGCGMVVEGRFRIGSRDQTNLLLSARTIGQVGYLADIWFAPEERPSDPRTQAYDMWQNMFEGFAVFVVMVTIIGSFMWLIRTVIDYRRWGRLTKVQQDVHTKLLDRFTANDDLLAYMRTPAGERFLESAPIALDGDARPMAAPMRRILWGIQAGMVLLAAGIGLQFVAGRVPEELAAPLSGVGILATAVGLGFVASAAASYVLSRRLEREHGKVVKLKGFPREHKVKMFRVVLSTQRADYVVTNEFAQDNTQAVQEVCGLRWKMQFHRRDQTAHWIGRVSMS